MGSRGWDKGKGEQGGQVRGQWGGTGGGGDRWDRGVRE